MVSPAPLTAADREELTRLLAECHVSTGRELTPDDLAYMAAVRRGYSALQLRDGSWRPARLTSNEAQYLGVTDPRAIRDESDYDGIDLY